VLWKIALFLPSAGSPHPRTAKDLTLRVTRLRSVDGEVIIVPNV
jgi:hypothetical protein